MMSGDKSSMYPESWEVVKLGSFVESEKGKKPKNQAKEQSSSYSLPYIDIEAFEKGNINSWTDGRNCRICNESDFLMVWDGSRSGLVGKGMKGALGSTLIRINFPLMENQYAFHFLQSKYLQINSRTKGSGTPHVDPDLLWNYEFPIPPLNEQRRIVSKINELLSELDKGMECLETARKQLKLYRQAVLKHAFEGKLTAKWREENQDELETTEQLLTRIERVREERFKQLLTDWKLDVEEWEAKGKLCKKPTKPRKPISRKPASNGSPFPALPTTWRWATVSEIVDRVTDGTHQTPNYTSSGIPFISVKDIRHERVSFDDCQFISQGEHEALIQRCYPQSGDLLITKSGTIGRLATVPDREFSLFVSVALVKIQSVRTYISQKWLRYAFEYHIMGLNINQQIKGGLLKNYHLEDIRLAKLPLCCTQEQEELVLQIENKLSAFEDFDATLNKQLLNIETLRQAILKHAFTGQLVEQDSHDEPASDLLNRICATKNVKKSRTHA